MIVARWIQASKDPGKPANMRDEAFDTKRDLFDKIARSQISNIVKIPAKGGKLYAITLKAS